jgi:hypothetical protein
MKKVLATLISIILILAMASSTTFAFVTGPVSEEVVIEHNVDSISDFTVKAKNITKFEGTSSIEVATVKVKNNTRDGYSITLNTLNGFLKPASTTHGEANISYTLSKTGGTGVPTSTGFTALNMPTEIPSSADGDDAHLILGADDALTGGSSDLFLTSPSDTEFAIKVAISDAGFLEMAGTYADVITLTYTDN